MAVSMARARSLVLACCLLLSCLAADVLAKRIDSRIETAAADSGLVKAKTKAIYDCPDTPRMSGCAETGCALHMHGKTSTLICAQCKNEKAYVLVNKNTRKAQCECAPGYAGKGQDGVCKKCPAGTDIAEGGSIAKSVCTKCPEGSYVNDDATDCVCPAGHYRAAAPDQPVGFKKIECKPCAARNAYVEADGHTQASCKLCTPPSVANKDHTKCVLPDSEDASSEGGIMSSLAHSPLGGLAQAFEEGRQQVQGQRLSGGDAPGIKSLASRVRNVFGRRSATTEEVEVEEEVPKVAKSQKAAPVDEVEIDQAEVESESDSVAAEAQAYKGKHAHKDHKDSHKDTKHYDSDSEEEYSGGKKEHKHESKKGDSYEEKKETYETKEHKHHSSKDSYSKHEHEDDDYKEHKHSSKSDSYEKDSYTTKDKDSYSKDADYKQPNDKKSYYEKRAASQSKTESEESDAEQPKTESKPEAQPKANSKQDSTSSKSGESKAEPTPEKKSLEELYRRNKPSPMEGMQKPTGPVKAPPIHADPDIIKKLIPDLPADEEEITPKNLPKQAPKTAPKDASKDAPKTAPKEEEKKGPLTLRDIAKKVGSAFGATTGPVANPLGNPMGFIDPEALADAGLPPVSNVGQLMGALIKKQMGELDLDEWSGGIRGGQQYV